MSNTEYQVNDVLLGRGGNTNNHSGNKQFRKLVAQYRNDYLKSRKRDKRGISHRIVCIIKSLGGRFLKRDESSPYQKWVEVEDKRAYEKASQALREGLDVRKNGYQAERIRKKELRKQKKRTDAIILEQQKTIELEKMTTQLNDSPVGKITKTETDFAPAISHNCTPNVVESCNKNEKSNAPSPNEESRNQAKPSLSIDVVESRAPIPDS